MSMAYQQPYPMSQGQGFNQIIRRPLTDAERQLPTNVFRTLQRGLRGIAVVCLLLFVLNVLVLPSVITDPITYDSVSMTLTIFMVVLGAVAFGMSVNTIVVRKKVERAMRDGTGVEVFGPAYRSAGVGKAQTWTVGPVSMMPTRELMGLMREGMPTSVLCIPAMKAAVAVNNCGLKAGARIMIPPNLEAMAVPVGIPTMPMGGQGIGPYQGLTQPIAPQRAYGEELPPPPPD